MIQLPGVVGSVHLGAREMLKDVRVLGVDPSTVRTGWGLVGPDGYLSSGTIPAGDGKAFSQLDAMERCVVIANELGALLGDLVEDGLVPSFIYVERSIVPNNRRTALLLAHLGGSIAQEIASRGMWRVNLVAPSEWRKLLGLKPGKTYALEWTRRWLVERGLPFMDMGEDELEAIAIAEAGRREVFRGANPDLR